MTQYYRIAVITGAAWIYAGLITGKLLRIRKTSRTDPLKKEIIRLSIDFLILLVLFLSPFYEFWFTRSPKQYVSFVIRFSELIFDSLLISMPIDRILRQKYYKSANIQKKERLNEGLRNATSTLVVAYGLVLFEGTTVLTYHIGLSIPFQIFLPSVILLFYRVLFLLIHHLRTGINAFHLRNSSIRILQYEIAVAFWIQIVVHIENNNFPKIRGIPDATAAALCIIVLVTGALGIIVLLNKLIIKPGEDE